MDQTIEKVSDLSTAPVEPLPPSPADCQNCMKLRNLLGRLRTRMNSMETELVNLLSKMETVPNATPENAAGRKES